MEYSSSLYEAFTSVLYLKVPMGGEERMKDFPSFVPQDVMLEGIGAAEAVADIKLSSAGKFFRLFCCGEFCVLE